MFIPSVIDYYEKMTELKKASGREAEAHFLLKPFVPAAFLRIHEIQGKYVGTLEITPKKPLERERLRQLYPQKARTSAISPLPVHDKAMYLFGRSGVKIKKEKDDSGNPIEIIPALEELISPSAHFEAYIQELKRLFALTGSSPLQILINYLTPIQNQELPFGLSLEEVAKIKDSNFIFVTVEDENPLTPEMMDILWEEADSGIRDKCLVCEDENALMAPKEYNFNCNFEVYADSSKGVPRYDAGGKFISLNSPEYVHQGQNMDNLHICKSCLGKFNKGLQWIKESGSLLKMGPATFMFFGLNPSLLAFIREGKQVTKMLHSESPLPQSLQVSEIRSIYYGTYIGHNGRVALTSFAPIAEEPLLANVIQWQKDLGIQEKAVETLKIEDIYQTVYPGKAPFGMEQKLFEAMIYNRPLPDILAQGILHQLDVHRYKQTQVSPLLYTLLKVYLKRKGILIDKTSEGYRLGEILALGDGIQKAYYAQKREYKTISKTLSATYYSPLSQHPQFSFETYKNQVNIFLKGIKRIDYQTQLRDLFRVKKKALFLPSTLDLSQKCLMAIGFTQSSNLFNGLGK